MPLVLVRLLKGGDILSAWIAQTVDGDHAFAVGVKRDFLQARESFVELARARAGLVGGHQDGAFGGVTHHAVGGFAFAFAGRLELGVVIQRPDPERGARRRISLEVHFLIVQQEVPHRVVAAAGNRERFTISPQAGNGHLILGQGAGLIRANHSNRTEGLNGGKLADKRVTADHFAHAACQTDGNNRGQAFRHRRDGK